MCAVASLPHLLLNGIFCSDHPILVLYRVYVGCDGGGERKLITCVFNQQLSNLRTRIKGAAPMNCTQRVSTTPEPDVDGEMKLMP